MAKKKQKKKKKMPEQAPRPKDFLDMIAPAAVKFNTDHFILGSRYHTAMALKSYPPMTDELALLRGLGDMGGVNLRLTARYPALNSHSFKNLLDDGFIDICRLF